MNMKASQIIRGEPVILEGQSIVLREVKAEALAREEPEDSNILLQKYFQQVKQFSPENRLSKFCKEAGFMSVGEVGQYFVTRNASEFLLRSVACREYTLPRDDPASEPKGWIQGNTRIGPILEVTTSFQHFKFGVEVRIQSMKEDNSHFLGQNFLRNHSLCEQLHQVQHPKVLQVHKKMKQYQQAQKLLQPDRRQKRNPNRGNLLARRPFH